MTTRRFLWLSYGTLLLLALAMASLLWFHYDNLNQLERSQANRYQSYLLADELRQSSDDLTRLARTYVVTGDPRYEGAYWEVLAIRNGTRPRPLHYGGRIYWDLRVDGWRAPRGDGPAVALDALMLQAGFTQAELAKLAEAKANSDRLVAVERTAMDALKGRLSNGGDNALHAGPPDQATAIRLMHDATYHAYKAGIMRPIDEFLVLVDQRTAATVQAKAQRSLIYVALIAALLGVLVVLWLLGRSLGRAAFALEGSLADLRVSEARYRTLVEQAPDAILVYDTVRGAFTEANPRAERLFGCSRAELLRSGPERFVADPPGAPVPQAVTLARHVSLAANGSGTVFEQALQTVDGRELVCEVHLAPLPTAGGSLVRASYVDVSERRRLAAEVERQRLRTMEADRLRALGDMATGIAHELNQPLNGIRAFAEGTAIGLRRAWPLTTAELTEAMDQIVNQVDRMTRVIDHMRILAHDRSQFDATPFDLREVVNGALALMGAQLRAQGIGVEADLAADLPLCQGRATAVEQVVLHLLRNAQEAFERGADDRRDGAARAAGPLIRLRAWHLPEDGCVRLSVADNAGGVPDAAVGRIFEPFFTTKRVGEGSGIGLAVARGIIDQHHGRIEVDNRPGQGLTLTLVLPAITALGA